MVRIAWLKTAFCVVLLQLLCCFLLDAQQGTDTPSSKPAEDKKPETEESPDVDSPPTPGTDAEPHPDAELQPPSVTDTKLRRDGEIVVTASRLAGPAADTCASVSVLRPSEGDRVSAKFVDDLLRRTHGIDVRRIAGIVTPFQRVSLRGMGGPQSRTLVLRDGIPQGSPYAGTVDWNALGLDGVERIEVVRGPMSSLYGSNAMGGVINVISRRPEKEFESSFSVGYGNWNTFVAKTHIGAKIDDAFAFALDTAMFDSEGYKARPRELRRWYDIRRKADQQNYSARLFFDFDEARSLDVVINRSLGDYNFGRKLHYGREEQNQGSITFESTAEPLGFKIQTYITGADLLTVYDRTTGATAYLEKHYINSRDDLLWGTSIQASYRPYEWWRVTVGNDFSHGESYGRDRYVSVQPGRRVRTHGEQETLAWFLENEIKLFDEKLVLTFGGRHDTVWNEEGMTLDTTLPAPQRRDYDDEDYECFTPRAGFAWHVGERTTLRAAAGRAFRSPNIFELYRTWRTGNIIFEGNPELGPEELTSYEVGIEQWLSDSLRLTLTHYQSFATDFIYSITVGGAGTAANPTIRQRNNVGEVVMRGAELEVECQLSQEFTWFANCTYSTSTVVKCDPLPALEGKTLDYTPRWKASGGLAYENPEIIDASLTCRFVDERFTEDTNRNDRKVRDYVVVDLALSRRLGKHFRLFLNIDNVFDREYQEIWESDAPGRFFFGGVELEF